MPEERGIGHKPNSENTSINRGKNWLLVIGIDEYTHHRKLGNAVADAQGFAGVMTERYGFEFLHKPLYNAEASRAEIVEALSKCEDLGEHDRLIVFYAGHGWYKMKTKHGYLVPSEAESNPNRDFISVNAVYDIFKAVDAKHILLIVDCCFGASFGLERDAIQVKQKKKVATDLDTKRSRRFLSSGGVEPVSDGFVTGNHSPFTAPLLDILKSNDKPVTVLSEVFPLLREKTNWNTDQMPQYEVLRLLGHDGGELALYCTVLESPEERAYKAAKEADTVHAYERFIIDFRKSAYKAEIKQLLKDKRASLAWAKIKNSNRIDDFDDFIEKHEDSPLAELAQKRFDELANVQSQKELDIEAERQRQAAAEQERLKNKAQQERQAEEQLWQDCQTKQTPSVYLEKYPKGRFAETAINLKHSLAEKERLAQIEPEMVFVKGGTFKMGSNEANDEKPIHDVTLKDFSIGKYPITVGLFKKFMAQSNYKTDAEKGEGSNIWTGSKWEMKKGVDWRCDVNGNPRPVSEDNHPVIHVSWNDALAFSEWLAKKTGKKYRLPTEAEWEFAARGGTKSKDFKYAGSNDLKEVAWYSENAGGTTHEVGTTLKANELGIYDMSGNVWEWCEDWFGAFTEGAVTNPKGAETGSYRVIRGGGWAYDADYCRSTYRRFNTPSIRHFYLGFRLVSSLQ